MAILLLYGGMVYLNRSVFKKITILVISAILLFVSCSNSQNETLRPGKINLLLTDFPLQGNEVSKVLINIKNITVSKADGQWLTVVDFDPEGGMVFDLLTLQNGTTASLGAFFLAPGKYNQIRLHLNTNNFIEIDLGFGPQLKPLETPSATHTGIKLVNEFEVTEDGDTTITIDFDASKSIIVTGSNKYILKPTIRTLAVETTQDFFSLTPLQQNATDFIPALPTNASYDNTIPPNGLVALRSISIGDSSNINSNIYVLGVCGAGDLTQSCLNSVEVYIATNVVGAATNIVKANRVEVGASSNFAGTIEGNVINKDASATIATELSPLSTLPYLPDFSIAQVSFKNLTELDSPLDSGNYRNLNISDNTVVELNGGIYHFRDINLGNSAAIKCLEVCFIIVKSRLKIGSQSVITSTLNDPNAIYVYINGTNGLTGGVGESPKAVEFGLSSNVTANVYAPFGTLEVGSNSTFKGAGIGREISIGSGSSIIGTSVAVIFAQDYIAEAMYKGEALQYHFGVDGVIRMLSSNDSRYVYKGSYSFNIITNMVYITYDEVEVHDLLCFECGVQYTLPASDFVISNAYTGFELINWSNTSIDVTLLADGAPLKFFRRVGFGPYDEILF